MWRHEPDKLKRWHTCQTVQLCPRCRHRETVWVHSFLSALDRQFHSELPRHLVTASLSVAISKTYREIQSGKMPTTSNRSFETLSHLQTAVSLTWSYLTVLVLEGHENSTLRVKNHDHMSHIRSLIIIPRVTTLQTMRNSLPFPWRSAACLCGALHVKCYSYHASTSVTVSGGGRNATVHDPKP